MYNFSPLQLSYEGWVPEASPELWHVEGGDKRKTALLRPY